MRIGIKTRAGIFVGLAALTILLCHVFPNAATNPEAGLILWLPEETEELEGENIPISEMEKKTLPPDTTYLKRVYRERYLPDDEAAYRQMAVTLILAGSDRRSLHEPEVCLRGQGWEIENSRVVPIKTTGGTVNVKDLQLGHWLRNKDGSLVLDGEGKKVRMRAHYFYWWVSRDGSTPSSKKRILQTAWNNMAHNINDRWGYPSVMVPVDLRLPVKEGHEEARERASKFIRKFAPKFQRSLGAVEP